MSHECDGCDAVALADGDVPHLRRSMILKNKTSRARQKEVFPSFAKIM
jgi:hypothetical protein